MRGQLVNQNIQKIITRKLTELARPSLKAPLLPADLPEQHGQRIVKFVYHALFERDDGVVRNSNLLGTNLRAAFRDVAKSETELILQQPGAVAAVERMHFESGDSNEETRTCELFFLVVFAKNMTDVLAEKAFDALAELLYAVHVQLGNFPFHSLTGLERRDFAVDTIVPGNVGDKVFDSGKRFHGQDGDGLVLREIVHQRLPGQPGPAVDFRGAGAALPGFAIPADGEIGSEVPLNVVERVENDHARRDRDAIVDGLRSVRVTAN